jgi:hypothetical protein
MFIYASLIANFTQYYINLINYPLFETKKKSQSSLL